MPRHTLEAYGEIVETLRLAHKEKPFARTEILNLLLQELDVIREETQAAHLKTLVSLEYLILVSAGTAYQDTKYRLGPRGLGGTSSD